MRWVDTGTIPPGRAIDLGCGAARNAIFLAQRGFDVDGVDYSRKAIDWAAERVEAAGVAVPTSCREGICGTCVTRVLEGTPDHRDLFLTGDEQDANNCFTPCCSRAHGGFLLIDL